MRRLILFSAILLLSLPCHSATLAGEEVIVWVHGDSDDLSSGLEGCVMQELLKLGYAPAAGKPATASLGIAASKAESPLDGYVHFSWIGFPTRRGNEWSPRATDTIQRACVQIATEFDQAVIPQGKQRNRE